MSDLVDDGFGTKTDPNAPDMQKWMKLIPAVMKCGEAMDNLRTIFGPEVFAIVLTTFYDEMPGPLVQQVERYRYLNSRLQKGEKV